jgi:CheY-like chemotaxis protein
MLRVLIVDDDEAVRRAAQIALDANGFDVVTADGGQAGIDAIGAQDFDVAIVDLFMEGMDGLETTRAMRAHCPNLRIITASGFMFGGTVPDMPGFEIMALEAGANLTLYKPFRPRDLVQAIHKAMDVASA